MSGAERLAGLLPSLWRPEAGEDSLLNRLVAAVGMQMDTASAQVQHVLRAHYADSADAALTDAHYQHDRAARGQPPANVRAPKDLRELLTYPYVTDLARLAALLDLPPWTEPASLAETVEEYRERIADVLDAYRLGLTTRAAIAALVEAALPEDMAVPVAARLWPFVIEEPAGLERRRDTIAVPQAGDLIPPLWRWTPQDASGAPTVVLTGVEAQAGASAATVGPVIERYTPGTTPVGLGLAVRGTLAPGVAVRLTPAWRSALVRAGELHLSAAPDSIADTAGNGPWTALASLPSGAVRALATAPDGTLWLMIENAGVYALVRFDGASAGTITDGAPGGVWHALAVRGAVVYLATDSGLHHCPLWPQDGAGFALTPVLAVPEVVHALRVLPDGTLGCASANGLALLDGTDALTARLLPGVAVQAALQHRGRWYLATADALLLLSGTQLYRYASEAISEQQPDWEAIATGDAATAQSPLPAVRALAVTADGWLWLGTAAGLVRWGVADERFDTAQRAADGRSTRLHAYPDLGTGAVHALAVDHRGVLHIAADAGLLRCTGRDLAQMDFSQNLWLALGRAGAEYPDEITERPRAHYRWNRADAQWERLDVRRGRFARVDLAPRTAVSDACAAWLELPSVRGETGTDDGNSFTPAGTLAAADLTVRVKPDETRIVSGGLPCLPEHRPGAVWRYLQLEPVPLTVPDGRPWWSCEGRLFPPPTRDAPWPGRFRDAASVFALDGLYDDAVWSYLPCVRVALEWTVAPAIGVRVHLLRRRPDELIADALTARVWQLISRARAAGVPLALAVEGATVFAS